MFQNINYNDMDRKDLRIGDIICTEHGEDVVTEIHHNGIIGINSFDPIGFDSITPIPITTERMKKMGFECYKHNIMNRSLNNGYIHIVKFSNTIGKDYNVHIDNSDFESVGTMDVGSINELQHAVWDCLQSNLF
jgi:hypothetical protein